MSKVFLSYSHRDGGFVKELYRRLMKDGVECFFDKESIDWGANWVIELERGVDECEVIVLVLSPDFCRSEWTSIERSSSLVDDPDGLKKRLRPLLLEPCGDALPRFLKPIKYMDVSSSEKFEEEYPKICRELGGTIIEECHPTDRRNLPSICNLPKLHRMPYRSLGSGFVGRKKDLWEIHDILSNRKTAVVEGVGIVMGTGGLGKTQLAIEYVHRFGKFYPGGVFWVEADHGVSAMMSCVVQAANVDIDNTLQERDQLYQLWNRLNRFQSILIVLDNFPEDEPLQPWLPSVSSIHVLVTTRRRDLNYSRLSLKFLSSEEGINLLNTGRRKFGQEAKNLVEALGGLPLALELTGNFLNLRSDLNIDTLLEEMKKVGEITTLSIFADTYADELPTGHIKEISATFQMSWDLASPTAKEVLQCISILAPTPIPRRLIRNILNLPSHNILKEPLDEAISELAHKLSLVELDEESNPWMHRLISGFTKITIGENRSLYDKVFRAVEGEMARVDEEMDTKAYHELEKIVPHAEIIVDSECMGTERAIDLLDYLRGHNRKWGRYRIAEKYGRKSLDLCVKHLEPGHPSIAISQSNLALVLQDLGELEEARDLLRDALNSAQKSFEPGHPSIAIRQSNLALVLKDLGELEEARDLAHQAYEIFLIKFGPQHPNTQTAKRN
ncbi:MAG: TIR domain-containing protein [Candidatus Scalindua sp. AMX11]|nr:MAG: TIR domain-containing protein [Candidatus Scalindua sp.]NOG84871.1 tetratricopeptide repeat protein [Planctomycetota bacterium]RZV84940.1 MAG: tetratricopeptide repeat protein [Candidatus Scalindua sp. SCAELEC01]TDE65067.1 MAG: TIR domain-containing protein [Candidatus Scalindua sp. AMX11]GJQ59459.1 MAG: hypothetical protein SCALA701_22600 [Candidatus Scalindua sp.]